MTILPRRLARAKILFAAAALLSSCHHGAAEESKPDSSVAAAHSNDPAGGKSAASASANPSADGSSMSRGVVRFDTPRGVWGLDVELARTEEEHARGLMFRRELGADQGMLFLFDEPRVQRFWMHNTLLRLDMIFIGEDRTVVGVVENAAPQTDTPREVAGPSRYVLEVAGGEASAHGVGPGVRAQFVGVDE